MKANQILFLISLFLLTILKSATLQAQCSVGFLRLTTQLEVNNFAMNYSGCTEVIGTIQIEGRNISNLNGIAGVTSISGTLSIYIAEDLVDISGLSNLESIGSLYICYAESLADLSPLSTITSVAGNINICSNNSLESLNGLQNMIPVSSGLFIENNPILTDISALSGITALNFLDISDNNILPNLNGLENLTSIEGRLELTDNPLLQSLSPLSNLDTINSLKIRECDALIDLTGLEKITSIPGNLEFFANPNLETLHGLHNLSSTGGNIYFWGNTRLNSISAFSNLTTIVGNFGLTISSFNMSDLSGLENITSIGGHLELNSLSGITNLSELANLNTVGRNMIIQSCNGLTDLSGLDKVIDVGGNLDINRNADLTSLNGLSKLGSIGGNLIIERNNDLTDISALGSVCIFPDYIDIKNNGSLTTCAVQAICDRLAIDINDSKIDIQNNSTGCNSNIEVNTGCLNAAYPISTIPVDLCQTVATVDISTAQNNNCQFINILDGAGHIICALNANGNDLGLTNFELFIPSEDRPTSFPIINRDLSISPTTQPLSPVRLRLYYTAAEYAALQASDPNVTSYTDIGFFKSNDACDGLLDADDYIPQSKSGLYAGADIFVEVSISSFSSFHALGSMSILPIELTDFEAVAINSEVLLNWSTASETNNEYIFLERSKDGINFSEIYSVKGAGTSNELINYAFLDTKPFQGINYYRLGQMDFDGTNSYSKTISIKMVTKENDSINFYPNPSNNGLIHLDYSAPQKGEISLDVYDLSGNLIIKEKRVLESGANTLSFDWNILSKGAFIVTLNEGPRRSFQKLIIH